LIVSANPLSSLAEYSRLVVESLNRPAVHYSTIRVWSDSPYTGTAEGEVFFMNGLRLRLREELDFGTGLISAYGYEVYRGKERLFWYDDFPHPNDVSLASTFPHHKHVPPEIKSHRIPAPGISYERPNLPILIEEIETLVGDTTAQNHGE
jgi:hypothetical protein